MKWVNIKKRDLAETRPADCIIGDDYEQKRRRETEPAVLSERKEHIRTAIRKGA
jgi:hypothetical protein